MLTTQIKSDMTTAMKARDALRVETLRETGDRHSCCLSPLFYTATGIPKCFSMAERRVNA